MSDQLLGVIVGALIGFTGSYLVARLQREADKERRREERLWHYRQEQIRRLRPTWQRAYEMVYRFLTVLRHLSKGLDDFSALQETESDEELLETVNKHIGEVTALAENFVSEFSESPPQMLTVLALHEPELHETMRKRIAESLHAANEISKSMEALAENLLQGVEVSPDEIAKAKKHLAAARRELIQNIHEVETSIERYITHV